MKIFVFLKNREIKFLSVACQPIIAILKIHLKVVYYEIQLEV